jgi:SAM-dependent methyltransferase
MKLSLTKNYFDKVILSEVLEHLEDDLKGLKSVIQSVKPGGMLIITVPNKNYPFCWDPINKFLELFFHKHIKEGFWAGIWNMHLRLYLPEQIITLCQKAGLKIQKVIYLTHYCFPFNHILLYAFKKILNKKVLPKKFNLAADKFSWEEANKQRGINPVRLGYNFLNLIDKLNQRKFTDKNSTVSILVKAIKS